jgi:hypothetical protein
VKEIIIRKKRQPTGWEKILASCTADDWLLMSYCFWALHSQTWKYLEGKNRVSTECVHIYFSLSLFSKQYRIRNYLPSICIVLGIISNLEVIEVIPEGAHRLYANTVSFYRTTWASKDFDICGV